LPSWLFYLQFGEILTSLAYAIATNFLESVLVLILPLVICFILPRKWFLESFIARSTTLISSGLTYAMYVLYRFPIKDEPPTHLLTVRTPLVLVITVVLVYLAGRLTFLRKTIEAVAERATVFLLFSLPASFISFLVVLIRNIF
jgi:hypothetical protein